MGQVTPSCSLCGEALEARAAACPRCGLAAPGAGAARAPPRGARVVGGLTVAAALLTVALPVLAKLTAADPACEPRSLGDWHLAMRRACVTPAYVCENLTASKLLQDPEVARVFRQAITAGSPEALDRLDALVGHVRDRFGCGDAGHPVSEPPDALPALPPGHPPIGGGPGVPTFEGPGVLTI